MKMQLSREQRDLVSRALVQHANAARHAATQEVMAAFVGISTHRDAMMAEARDADTLGARFSQAHTVDLSFTRDATGTFATTEAERTADLNALAERWLVGGADPAVVFTTFAALGTRKLCDMGQSLSGLIDALTRTWAEHGGRP